jgi:RNA polymerase sigma-70 factor (ECF subfamily)
LPADGAAVPDAELAARAARGDHDALDALLDRHAQRVYAVCVRIVGNRDDALDATQDALIAVARGIARFNGASSFTTWLYRVATNAALDEVRRRSRRPLPSDTLPEPPMHSSPEMRVADQLVIDAALRTVPVEFRAAVVLRDLADLDYAQIGAILDIPAGTVRSRIARGRAALARALPHEAPAPRPAEPRA